MLKVLIKKQLSEVFKSYFFDAKKNRMRPKWAIAAWFVFFAVIMVGMLGGIFTYLSLTMCKGMTAIGMGWFYFLLMGGITIVMGAFGSVFNTYASLYLAKDNDLLLSLPIPVRTIMAARLFNVHLMGAMYAATVLIPALVVYWVVAGVTVARVICGLLLFVIISVIVLLLSCVLGWAVARVSLRLKNKSFATAAVSLLFVGAYYFFYFKANDFIKDLIVNAQIYGARIKGAGYGFYLFGRIGEGDWLATAIFLGVTAALFALVWTVMCRSFLSIATASGGGEKVRYVEKPVRQKSVFGALLGKELARFTASANYMLNCGLGILLLPATGALLLIKGKVVIDALNKVFAKMGDSVAVLACAVFCLLASMIDIAAPSVSLEGKSLWIPQSLPVMPKAVLRAKASAQLILTGVPMLVAVACAAIVVPGSAPVKLLLCATPLVYSAFLALYGTTVGVKMPLLNWTNETAPIKQSGAVTLALLSGMGFSIALGVVYLLIGYRIGAMAYLGCWLAVFAVAALLLLRWLDRKGSRLFAEL